MLSIIMVRFIINSHPAWNEYLLPILQIYIAYIWNLDNFFPTTTEDPNYDYDTSYEYNWYYGFQAFYFHFAILQLGYQIWPQAVALIVIYTQYVSYYPTETLEYSAMCLTIFLVFIGLLVMKYTNENIKRLQFRDSREQNRWIKIIDQVLEQSIVVIKFDHKQDQLILQQINDISKKRLKIQNNIELREMLRNMIIENTHMEREEIKQKNLEQEIRDLIIKNDQYRFITHQVDVQSNVLNKEYKVKLIQQVLQDEYCVIAIFEQNLKNETHKLQLEVRCKENIFQFLLKQFFQQMKTASTRLKILYSMINFQQIRLLLNNNNENLKSMQSWVSTSLIRNQMNIIFSKKVKVSIKKDLQGFVTNQVYLFSILMSISQIFDEFHHMKIKGKQVLDVQRVKLTLIGRMNDALSFQKLLKQNLNLSQSFTQNQKIILKHLQKIIANKKIETQEKNQLLSIYLNKFLLWEGFREKHFSLKTKEMIHLSFEFEV
ncbi:unnamed protein product [Paramecium octaurelia]|uniref:Transmembrane protein n=1 Tax=Paramecium octaurelia TaxID=43137 RepID=A0A8S1T3P7_PAROT|nr:unnamed protein product [Paramecium octaurelia]